MRNRNVIPFIAAGKELSTMLNLKRRYIENCLAGGDIGAAQEAFDESVTFLRSLRATIRAEGIGDSLCDSEKQQHEAICGIRIIEQSLKMNYPELSQ